MVDTLAQRYGVLPSQILAEDAGYLLPMLALIGEAAPDGK